MGTKKLASLLMLGVALFVIVAWRVFGPGGTPPARQQNPASSGGAAGMTAQEQRAISDSVGTLRENARRAPAVLPGTWRATTLIEFEDGTELSYTATMVIQPDLRMTYAFDDWATIDAWVGAADVGRELPPAVFLYPFNSAQAYDGSVYIRDDRVLVLDYLFADAASREAREADIERDDAASSPSPLTDPMLLMSKELFTIALLEEDEAGLVATAPAMRAALGGVLGEEAESEGGYEVALKRMEMRLERLDGDEGR